MMRLYEQGSSHRLKTVGFRPNYVGGIFYEEVRQSDDYKRNPDTFPGNTYLYDSQVPDTVAAE